MKIRNFSMGIPAIMLAALACVANVGADTAAARCDIYPAGEDHASASIPCTFSQRQGFININRSDGVSHDLTPSSDAPGNYTDQNGRPVYRQSGLSKDGTIFRFPDESIFLFWDAVWGTENGFEQVLQLQGISFTVNSANAGSLNTLTIQSAGLEVDNTEIVVEIDGTVSGAEIADLDGNGWPEIYVYVNSAGSGSYGSLVAYAVNNGKSLSGIYLPPISDDKVSSAGYMGHDEFAVTGSVLTRRFPIYLEGDTNSKPSGGMRQIQYKLTQGEASWVLKPGRATPVSNR